jgi:adenylate cyclase
MAIDWNPAFVDAHAILAAARAHEGRIEEARAALREVMRQMPGLTAGDQRLIRPFRKPADQERLVDGLRKAGLTRGEDR